MILLALCWFIKFCMVGREQEINSPTRELKLSWVYNLWPPIVQAHLACCKGLDRLWVDSKQNQSLEVKYLDLFFLECIFSIWKVWQNNNLTLITTKLKYTFDLNSLPLSSSPVSLMNFSNVQIYNTIGITR